MTIGIVGASGLIGYSLFTYCQSRSEKVIGTYAGHKKEGLNHFDLRADSFDLFDSCDCVVIAAALTNIDECGQNKALCRLMNVDRTTELISYLSKKKIRPIFLSSDQVFDGTKGNYSETDLPGPVNYYGSTKLEAETFIQNNCNQYLILRLSKVFSRRSQDRSMYTEVLLSLKNKRAVKAAYNQIYNPTDVVDLSRWIYEAIKGELQGLYHLASPEIMSRYDFALKVARENNADPCLIEKVDFLTLPCREKRALNSSLNTAKIRSILGSLNEN
jgi:dTDP-4-dehydrorhamnose reductase